MSKKLHKQQKKTSAAPVPQKQIKVPKTELRNLAVIVLAALVLRFIFFFELKNSPLFTVLFSDPLIFSNLAMDMVRNNKWFGDFVFYMSPGYTYFLAIIYSVFGNDVALVRMLQIFINAANVVLIFYIGKGLFSARAGYAAAIIAALYSVFIFYSSVILLEILFTFFISLLILYLLRSENRDRKYWLITGIYLGAAAILRGNILLFYPFIIAWIFLKGTQDNKLKPIVKAVFLSIGIFLPVLPVVLNNYAAEKEFVILTSSSGINFYIGNHNQANGIYKIPDNIDLTLDPSGEHYAERESGKELNSSEVSDFWSDKGFDYMTSQPLDALILTAKKFFLFFDDNENPQSSIMDPDFYGRNYSFLLKLPLPGFYLVFILAVFGIALSIKKDDKFQLMYSFILSYVIGVIIFFVMGRFRVGLAPVLIVFAGYGLLRTYDLVKEGQLKKLIVPAAVVIMLAVINYFYIPEYSFSDYDAYISLGNSHFEKQEYDEALENYKKSLSLKEESGTYVMIGNSLAVKKDVRGAFEAYKKAIELNTANPSAHFHLGTLFVRTGDYTRAKEAFKAAVSVDSSFADAYRNLGIIYYMEENYSESLLFFEKYLYLSKDEEAKITVRKDIEELMRKLRR